jgi:hypothetical protein
LANLPDFYSNTPLSWKWIGGLDVKNLEDRPDTVSRLRASMISVVKSTTTFSRKRLNNEMPALNNRILVAT